MEESSTRSSLGVIRSAAVISLGMVALAGSIASVLVQRLLAPSRPEPVGSQVSKLVTDEWDSDLARLNLPSRSEVDALNRQIAELEAEIDQLLQARSQGSENN